MHEDSVSAKDREVESEWWESIPNLDLVKDINPALFIFNGEKPEPPQEATDAELAEALPAKMEQAIERIERAAEKASEPKQAIEDPPLPTKLMHGAIWYLKGLLGFLLVAVIGSVVATYLMNAGVNPEYTFGDALNFWVDNIKGLFGMK